MMFFVMGFGLGRLTWLLFFGWRLEANSGAEMGER